jgi:DNA polymerase III subunit delta
MGKPLPSAKRERIMPKVTLYCGEEDFLLDEELNGIRSKFSEFNSERINGASSGIDRILAALTSLPMLGGERLVIIDDLDYEEEDEEKLFKAIQNLAEGVRLIFVNYNGVDKRTRFYKLMDKIGEVKEFKRFTDWEQDKGLAWIVNNVRSRGKKISGGAANLLIEMIGMNLRMLDKEIEKIATFIGDKPAIEQGDVEKMASSGEADSFALSNALREKDPKGAMESLNRLFKDNEDPHMMLGMLAKLYRTLLQVKCLEDRGMGQYDIARELKAKPFFVKKCMERTSVFSVKELILDMKRLHKADLKMKSGSPARLTFEMLVGELCNG